MQSFTTPTTEYFGTLPCTSDTQTPQMIIPVFLIHTLEQPFCSQSACACHQNQVAVTALFAAIDQGALTLGEVRG